VTVFQTPILGVEWGKGFEMFKKKIIKKISVRIWLSDTVEQYRTLCVGKKRKEPTP
jgi:hypothetical protein